MSPKPSSEYQKYCSEIIERAIETPSLVYSDLEELHSLLGGHWSAFYQAYNLQKDKSFNWCFSNWLYRSTSESCSDGWSNALKRLAKKSNEEVNKIFAEYVNEFLSIWFNSPDGIINP